jgi:hypothetical protein
MSSESAGDLFSCEHHVVKERVRKSSALASGEILLEVVM